MEELLELDKKENPEKYASENTPPPTPPLTGEGSKRKEEKVQAVGYIMDVRKIITKTGKPMLFLKCDGFDYQFEVVVFPKDIEKYGDTIQPDRVIIITGNLSVNFEYGRKSIQTREMKIVTLSQVREQARDLDLFDDKKRYTNVALNSVEEDLSQPPSPILPPKGEGSFEADLEARISDNKTEKEQKFDHIDRYVVDIPAIAQKEDLQVLKSFLIKQKNEIFKY